MNPTTGQARLVGGIFVGGASSRMGRAKGLLPAPSGARSLVEHAARVLASVGAEVVLVGQRDEYAGLPYPVLADAFRGIGPLGGLVSLLDHTGGGLAIACACDMPYVTEALARKLVDGPAAAVLTPFAGGVLQPLFARYDARQCAAVARRRAEEALAGGSSALQGLLRELAATPLALSEAEEAWLRDWDRPEDVEA